jgi:hypothetical protein
MQRSLSNTLLCRPSHFSSNFWDMAGKLKIGHKESPPASLFTNVHIAIALKMKLAIRRLPDGQNLKIAARVNHKPVVPADILFGQAIKNMGHFHLTLHCFQLFRGSCRSKPATDNTGRHELHTMTALAVAGAGPSFLHEIPVK